VVTGVLVYLALSVLFAVLGLHNDLITPRFLLAALAVAATFHAVEVGHNVFKRW
jgi:hypothetical protein